MRGARPARPLLLAILLGACASPPPPGDAAAVAQTAAPSMVKLGHHAAATLADGLKLEFADALEDSRCPQGVQCVWAGRARIGLLASKPGTEARRFELSLPGPAQVYLEYGIQLVALDPFPASGRHAAPGDYVATLSIMPASAVTPGKDPSPDLPRQ